MRVFTDNQLNLALQLKEHGFPQDQEPISYHIGSDSYVHLVTKPLEKDGWAFFTAFLPIEHDFYNFMNRMRLYDRGILYNKASRTIITHAIVKKPETKPTEKSEVTTTLATITLMDFNKNPDDYFYSSASDEWSALCLVVDQFLRCVKDIKKEN